jgi:hypothetical protein
MYSKRQGYEKTVTTLEPYIRKGKTASMGLKILLAAVKGGC